MAPMNPTIVTPQPTPVSDEQRLQRVAIHGTGRCVPDRVLTNDDLSKMVETSDEWIQERTGMRERRIAAPDQATSDLAIEAGRRALADADLDVADLQLILVATATPDTIFPPTACYVQEGLGAQRAAGFDISVACTGFVNALMVGESMVKTGAFRNALVIGAEKLSSIVDYSNRNTCVLFGDGAGAVVLGPARGDSMILDHAVAIDGSGAELIQQAAGGSRKPVSEETIAAGEHFLTMEGRKVFKFAVNAICDSVQKVLQRNGYTTDDLDLLVPHQANLRIIESATTRLGLPREKVVVNIEKYGNTSSASIPMALDEISRAGRVQPGQLVCLVAFGGGLSWGASLLRF